MFRKQPGLLGVPSSTLALGVNTYTSPTQQYTIGFGSEVIDTRLITVAPSVASPGTTWTFTVYVTNPPTTNGKPALNLEVWAQVVENRILGKTFDLQSSLPLNTT